MFKETTVRIKGGMPVMVAGMVYPDVIEDLDIRWYNTGKRVTTRFARSISESDMRLITEKLARA